MSENLQPDPLTLPKRRHPRHPDFGEHLTHEGKASYGVTAFPECDRHHAVTGPSPERPLPQDDGEGVPGLVLRLRQQGVRLRLDDGRVWGAGKIAAEDKAVLRRHRHLVVAILRAEQENEPIPSGPCYCCRSYRYWLSAHRHWVCAECHPPGSERLVLTRHEVPEIDPATTSRSNGPHASERTRFDTPIRRTAPGEDPMKSHPAADLFPMMSETALEALANDIRANGQNQPIITHKGMILDGRNRLLACESAGVEPRYEEWHGKGSPTEYVISANMHRRHLTQSQAAAVAVEALSLFEQEARSRQATSTGGLEPQLRAKMPEAEGKAREGRSDSGGQEKNQGGRARDRAAQSFGVSGRYVEEARRLKATDPELFARVKRGDLTISAARSKTKLSTEEMDVLVEEVNAAHKEVIANVADDLRRSAQLGHALVELKATMNDEEWGQYLLEHLPISARATQVDIELANHEHLIDSTDFVSLVNDEMLDSVLSRLDSGEGFDITEAWTRGIEAALAKSA